MLHSTCESECNLYLKYIGCPGKKFVCIGKEVLVPRNILDIGFNLYCMVHGLLNQVRVVVVVTFNGFWFLLLWVMYLGFIKMLSSCSFISLFSTTKTTINFCLCKVANRWSAAFCLWTSDISGTEKQTFVGHSNNWRFIRVFNCFYSL